MNSLIGATIATWLGLALCACGGEASTAAASGGGGAGGGTGGSAPNGCEVGTLEPGTHMVTLEHGGLERSYLLHLPPSYDGSTAVPLVLNFHGLTSTGAQQQLFSAMDATSDEKGFALAYPEGYMNSWNGGACCGAAGEEGIDDVAFARAVVADIAATACIDRRRVYSTGMSNGGIFSHRLGCEASDLVAAIAPVCGPLLIECAPERPMPIMHFYGQDDPLVSYDLGVSSNDTWIDKDGCSGAPETTLQQGAATCETSTSCDGGARVSLCTIEGMGHCWPGQSFCPEALGAANTDVSANEEMWAFFESFVLPE